MKIRLVLAISFTLLSITSGIEVFGMNENLNNNEEEESKDDTRNKYLNLPNPYHIKNNLFSGELRKDINTNEEEQKKNDNIFNENNDCNHKGNLMNNNANNLFFEIDTSTKKDDINTNGLLLRSNNDITTNSFRTLNFNNDNRSRYYFNSDLSNNELLKEDNKHMFLYEPFNGDKRNRVAYALFNSVRYIYTSSFGFTLFEIGTSVGLSILNNIIKFEKIIRNRFYANFLLLKFGVKLAIPLLSFIIVDVNICIYSLAVSCIKYAIIKFHKELLNVFHIEWDSPFGENKNLKKLICFFINIFNIDIKLDLFVFSLCLPFSKIVEMLIFRNCLQKIGKQRKNFNIPIVTRKKIVDNSELYDNILTAIENTSEEDIEKKIKEINEVNNKKKRLEEAINKVCINISEDWLKNEEEQI